MVIGEAAKRLNLTRTVFLLSVAREHAEHVPGKKQIRDEEECLLLSSQESVTVAELFLNPPLAPNAAQKKARKKWGEVEQR